MALAVGQRVRHPLRGGGRPLDVWKADRPAARRSSDLDAVDVNVVALTRTSKDVVERVASVSERVSPVGDHDRRLKLHAISIARPPTRRDTWGRWRPARVLGFGSAAALVVAGAICATLIGGSDGRCAGHCADHARPRHSPAPDLPRGGTERGARPRGRRSGDGSAPPMDNAGCGLAASPAGPASSGPGRPPERLSRCSRKAGAVRSQVGSRTAAVGARRCMCRGVILLGRGRRGAAIRRVSSPASPVPWSSV